MLTLCVLKSYTEQSMHAYLKNIIWSTIKSTAVKQHLEALKKLNEKLDTRGKRVPRSLWMLAITLAGGEPNSIRRACLKYEVKGLDSVCGIQFWTGGQVKCSYSDRIIRFVGKAVTTPEQSDCHCHRPPLPLPLPLPLQRCCHVQELSTNQSSKDGSHTNPIERCMGNSKKKDLAFA